MRSEPESRMLLSTPDNTSSSGLSINFSGRAAKDAVSSWSYTQRYSPIRATTEDITMATETDKLVVLLTKGIDLEL